MDDLIRRQDAIDALDCINGTEEVLRSLPSAWENIDKADITKSVAFLDLFMKTFCRYTNDYERFDDLKFRCEKCTFKKGDYCLCKMFKIEFAPDYKDFGCMGDL